MEHCTEVVQGPGLEMITSTHIPKCNCARFGSTYTQTQLLSTTVVSLGGQAEKETGFGGHGAIFAP